MPGIDARPIFKGKLSPDLLRNAVIKVAQVIPKVVEGGGLQGAGQQYDPGRKGYRLNLCHALPSLELGRIGLFGRLYILSVKPPGTCPPTAYSCHTVHKRPVPGRELLLAGDWIL